MRFLPGCREFVAVAIVGFSTGFAYGDEPSGQRHAEQPNRPAADDEANGVVRPEPPAEATEAAAHPTAESANDLTLKFSFRDAPWAAVLQWFAEQAGLTLDLTDAPEGSFNYSDDREHSIAQALDVLNGYLLPRGYAAIRRDRFLVVVKTDNPILPNLIPTIDARDLARYGDNELLRVVVALRGLDPAKVAPQIEKLLGPHGSASALDASESVVIQGFGKALREVVELLAHAIVPLADNELAFRSFALKSIAAVDAERQIRNLFGLGTNPFAQSQARRSAHFERERRRPDEKGETRPAAPTPLMAEMAMNMKISALGRTNSLLVTGTPAAIKLVEGILKSIDVPSSGDELTRLDDSTPVLRVYILDDADEDDVAETIDAILPGVVINEDGRHDSVHVYATPREHQEVEKLIRIIDGGFGSAGSTGGVEVISLKRWDPYVMSDLLKALFENENRDDRPMIRPEPLTRSLAIRAKPAQMEQIQCVLASYGERPDAAAPRSAGSRFRKLSLPAADAERIARAVEDLLTEDRGFSHRIRVVVPSQKREAHSDRPSIRINTLPKDSARADRKDASAIVARPAAPPAAKNLLLTSSKKSPPAERAAKPGDDKAKGPGRVTIEVRDGELVIYSNDVVALDQVEDTIRELVRQMPARTEWTVFYLRAATADDVAVRLAELLRDDDKLRVGVGLPRADDDLTDLRPQSLRIIPDSRTNSLFVSGPPDKIDAAGKFLEMLDTLELPESLRDRVPRAIPVRYADVAAVADMVRELFKDYMEDPLAALRDSRRQDRRDGDEGRRAASASLDAQRGKSPGIRLTLSVDTRTNELLVSCSETLFRQISELVAERDKAAYATRPTIRVIRPNHITAPEIGLALDNLLPRVTMGTTGLVSPSRDRPRRPDRRD